MKGNQSSKNPQNPQQQELSDITQKTSSKLVSADDTPQFTVDYGPLNGYYTPAWSEHNLANRLAQQSAVSLVDSHSDSDVESQASSKSSHNLADRLALQDSMSVDSSANSAGSDEVEPSHTPLNAVSNSQGSVSASQITMSSSPWVNNTLWLTIVTGVLVISAVSSLSPVIFTIIVKDHLSHEESSLSKKIALPAAVWLVMAVASFWEYWHLIGKRADGRLDTKVQVDEPNLQNAPWSLVFAFLASQPHFFNGMLVVMAIPALKNSLIAALVLGSVLGSLNLLAWLSVDLLAVWRKIEGVKPFWSQPGVNQVTEFFTGLPVNAFFREVYPLVMSIIYTQAFVQTAFEFVSVDRSSFAKRVVQMTLISFLALLVQQSTALMTRGFDIRQAKEYADAQGFPMSMKNMLAASDYCLARGLDKLQRGQYLAEVLSFARFSPRAIAAIIAVFNALGTASLVRRGICNYVISPNARGGVLSHYFAGENAAQAIGRSSDFPVTTVAVLAGTTRSLTKLATVIGQLQEDLPRRTRPSTVIPQ